MPANPVPRHVRPTSPYRLLWPAKRRGFHYEHAHILMHGSLVRLLSHIRNNRRHCPELARCEIIRPDWTKVGQPSKSIRLP